MTSVDNINYPQTYDTDLTLFMVHDSLRMTLADDYNPGDMSITVTGDPNIMALFPSSGIITLTEQCSDPALRAISFNYTSRTDTTFDGLSVVQGFVDCWKPKNYTHVLQNVFADHHNRLKDACLAIEQFIGVAGVENTDFPENVKNPTVTGRLNFLRRLVYTPKAWFSVDKIIGIAPLTVTFTDQSLRNPTSWAWNFDDDDNWYLTNGTTETSIYPNPPTGLTPNITPGNAVSCDFATLASGWDTTIQHTFYNPGTYNVTLAVANAFGNDKVTIPAVVAVHPSAPNPATEFSLSPANTPRTWIGANSTYTFTITSANATVGAIYTTTNGEQFTVTATISSSTTLICTGGGAPNGSILTLLFGTGAATITFSTYTFTSPIKATIRINTLLNIDVTDYLYNAGAGLQSWGSSPPYSYDNVEEYTWKLGDDLVHNSTPEAIALYGIGGIYDVKLRVDTGLGAYRITTLPSAVDVIEQTNLWLLAFDSPQNVLAGASSVDGSYIKNASVYEFGLSSETWKSSITSSPLSVYRNYSFLNGYPNQAAQTKLFLRNSNMVQQGTVASGDGGQAIVQWASDQTTINYQTLTPFNGSWSASPAFGGSQTNNWNWFSFSDGITLYTLFGEGAVGPTPAGPQLTRIENNMATNVAGTAIPYSLSNDLVNGADELATYADNCPATYRACYNNGYGFFTRNDAGFGGFFRIRNFYRTEGTLTDAATTIRKLPDVPGSYRTELQLVPLSNGIYVFNNSGEVSVYNPTTNTWTSGGPSISSATFRTLQDSSVTTYSDGVQTTDYSSTANSLLASSDGDRRAYLSYDYSNNAFVQFNEADGSFTALTPRPTVYASDSTKSNEQFTMLVF
jgi:PKD repeat protein